IAAGLFSPEPTLRDAAVAAATALATRSYKRTREALPVPDGPLVVKEVLQQLGPDAYGLDERAQSLVALGPAIEKAAVAAVSTSPERARIVADALLAGTAKLELAPLFDDTTSPATKLDDRLQKQASDTIETVAAAAVPGFVALERHPDIEVRTRAVELLARRTEPEAQKAVVDALGDPEEAGRRGAVSRPGTG